MPSRRAGWAALALLALVVVSIALRSVAASAVEAPQLLCDEFIHAAESRGLWSEAQYAFRGEPAAPHSLLMPVVSGPAQLASGTTGVYSALKAINVLFASLMAVPVFLLARRIVPPMWALVAAALSLAIPGLVFSGLIMTESAFFPAVALAVLVSVRAVEEPTWRWQLFALGAIALAASIRPQGAVLVLTLIAAAPLRALFDARSSGRTPRLRELVEALWALRLSLGVLVGVLLLIPIARFVEGESPRSALGPYEAVLDGSYLPGAIAESAGLHAALLSFSAALIPMTALAIMTACALRTGGTRDAAERSFLAVALTSVVGTLAVTVGFAAAFTDGNIMERYFFSVTPVLMIALVLWLDRGLPRPRGTTAIAAAVPVVLIVGLPFGRYLDDGVPLDTPSAMLVPWLGDLAGLGATGTAAILILVGAAIAALAALAPRPVARIALPVIVGAVLVVGSVVATDRVQDQSEFPRSLAGPNPTWVDDAVGRDADVTFLDVSELDTAADIEGGGLALQAEFWNRSVRRWALTGASPCGLPADGVRLDASGAIDLDGSVGDHVVARREYLVAGDRTAVAGLLALTRVDQPLRVAARTDGIRPDGWFGDEATVHVPDGGEDGRGRVVLMLDRPAWTGGADPSAVSVSVVAGGRPDGTATLVDSVSVPAGGRRTVKVPVPSGPSTIVVRAEDAFTIEDLGLPAPEPQRRFSARLGVDAGNA